jgi:hypothetical protein
MWKEAVVVCFKVLSRNLPGETKENHQNLNLDSRSLDRDYYLTTSYQLHRSLSVERGGKKCSRRSVVNGCDDGIFYLGLLVFWTLSIV